MERLEWIYTKGYFVYTILKIGFACIVCKKDTCWKLCRKLFPNRLKK